jgi:hypothetical protein
MDARERISYNSSHGYKYKEIKRGLALPLPRRRIEIIYL